MAKQRNNNQEAPVDQANVTIKVAYRAKANVSLGKDKIIRKGSIINANYYDALPKVFKKRFEKVKNQVVVEA